MALYLIIEERNAADELVSYAKYDITTLSPISLVHLPEPNTSLSIYHIDDLKTYMRRVDDGPHRLEPVAEQGAKSG